jgi:predicted double-glycine peptidase
MSPWQETVLAVAISLACFCCAIFYKRLSTAWMVCGVAGVAAAWIFTDFLSRQENGYLLAAAVPMFTAPLFRFPLSAIVRIGLGTAALVVTTWAGWLEFLSPALCRAELSRVKTWMTADGVCLQQTPYTCGPASAVTILRRLGVNAEEGEIALLSRSSRHAGTDPDELTTAIRQRFVQDGIHADAKNLRTFEELCQSVPALTVVRWGPTLDHWVAVLEITDRTVQFADPTRGICEESRANFAQYWEHQTVRIWRDNDHLTAHGIQDRRRRQ